MNRLLQSLVSSIRKDKQELIEIKEGMKDSRNQEEMIKRFKKLKKFKDKVSMLEEEEPITRLSEV